MRLDYGEGKEDAFERLRKQIGKSSERKWAQDIHHSDDLATKDDSSATQGQKRQRRYDVTNWLSSIDFAAQKSDIISRRQADRRIWKAAFRSHYIPSKAAHRLLET